MAAVMVIVVSLVIVLGLVLILLAELYCSMLFSRSQKNQKRSSLASVIEAEAAELPDQQFTSPPLNSFYAHGVLRAPRNFLFPAISDRNTSTALAADLEIQIGESPDSGTFRSPSASMRVRDYEDQLIYICNPIYDNNEAPNLVGKVDSSRTDTTFETPESSPSRLETSGSPGSSDNSVKSSSSPVVNTPPLTPMKRLEVPEDTSSLCLRDARSICTMGSDSNEVSSTTGSTRTSPSW